MNNNKLTPENLISLYKITIDEEHSFLKGHQDRVRYYTGITSGLVAATIAGIIQSKDWYHYALITLGPTAIFVISALAKKHSRTIYKLYLEAIVRRAKFELILDINSLKSISKNQQNSYWLNEPII